jgi:hypothetical protein
MSIFFYYLISEKDKQPAAGAYLKASGANPMFAVSRIFCLDVSLKNEYSTIINVYN